MREAGIREPERQGGESVPGRGEPTGAVPMQDWEAPCCRGRTEGGKGCGQEPGRDCGDLVSLNNRSQKGER